MVRLLFVIIDLISIFMWILLFCKGLYIISIILILILFINIIVHLKVLFEEFNLWLDSE